ncbi:Pentatricopeptide repeat [Macleaya cordata]|uniref:Pentatricopeptide repeat n=1 Tax=Macleaya cordata TaxID=56857 RepID=A0A200RC19_MACCD|nr:Pentatricopeptide repeat [Macleaya cordata]
MTTSLGFNDLERTIWIKTCEKSNEFSETHKVFDEMPQSNVISWTKMISTNAKTGMNDKALGYFSQMRRVGVEPNEMTFSIAVGVCCQLGRIDVGMNLHSLILKKGLLVQLFVSSGLITMYSKCDHVEAARRVFDEMLDRDAVSWNSMIAAYSQKDLYGEAMNVLLLMLKNGTDWKLLVNGFTFASILKVCSGLGWTRIGKSVHSCAIKLGFDSDVFVAGSMVDMYSKCGSLDMARRVFDRMERRDLVTWNGMITRYSQNYFGEEAIELFCQLQFEGFVPNNTTFSSVLRASTLISDSAVGRYFHAKALKCGCSSDVFVGTALVDMYSKYFDMVDAERAFQEMSTRNLISFNALITGYSLTVRYEEALRIYVNLLSENLRPDYFTFTGLFSACSVLGALEEGAQVHAHSFKFGLDTDVSVGNSLVNFYAKCGLMESASKSFKSVTRPNVVSWAGIISGFAQNGESEKALEYFYKMNKLSEKPDEFSFTSALKAVASCAAVEHGRHIHTYVIKVGLESSILIGSALIDVYSKCGMIDDSFKVFSEMPDKNVVSWNSMITGYAQNGLTSKSLLLFREMMESGLIPTSITFTGVLFACSSAGLVEEGRNFYNSMVFYYGIPPSVEHCTCMVHLLGRAGYLDDAETFLLNSPFPSEPGLWRSLLAACGVHKNMDVGVRAAEQCLRLEPHDSTTYVTLSNIYASKQLWHEVSRIRDFMREMGVEKEPGCSWIEVRNKVHSFVVEDRSYSPEEVNATIHA